MNRIALMFAAVLLSSCNYTQKASPSVPSTAVPVTPAPFSPAPPPVQTAPAPQAQPVPQTAPPVLAPAKEPVKRVPQEAKSVEANKVQEKSEEKKPAPTPAPAAAPATKEPIVASAPKAKGFDLDMLTKRLKQTGAIGVFTKLAINSDATDLIDAVKKYRQLAVLQTKLAEVRSRFDGLVIKILALLEDDLQLARDIYVAREQIWSNLLEVTHEKRASISFSSSARNACTGGHARRGCGDDDHPARPSMRRAGDRRTGKTGCGGQQDGRCALPERKPLPHRRHQGRPSDRDAHPVAALPSVRNDRPASGALLG